MGTKNNPGLHDCYAKAAPDEPIFVLIARDPLAPDLVREWARRHRVELEGWSTKIGEAMNVAEAMERWRRANPPDTKL